MNINPEVTSNATTDMYVFMKVVMPKCSLGGLYDINADWVRVDSYEQDGQWVEVYGYNNVLTPGQSTGQMADKATMKEIGLEEYVSFTNIQFSMTAYACGTNDETFEDAWGDIRTALGV